MRKCLVLATLLGVFGCFYDATKWSDSPLYSPLPMEWVVAPQWVIEYWCPYVLPTDAVLLACAVREPDHNRCFVVSLKPMDKTEPWVVAHEQKHCAGWVHDLPEKKEIKPLIK